MFSKTHILRNALKYYLIQEKMKNCDYEKGAVCTDSEERAIWKNNNVKSGSLWMQI